MVKSTFVERMIKLFQQLPEEDVELAIDQILEQLRDHVSRGKRVEIRGFGSFSLRYHRSRNARNPRTGEKIVSIAKHVPYFKPGKQLRDRLNAARQKNVPIVHNDCDD